ncbi:MAG: YgiQ family radical SAM protein [Nanoarchaeota archaeon]
MDFLPTNLAEGKEKYKDFEEFDVVFITGDPYYDHPLSGVAILSRLLDSKGYKVGIIAQPESDAEFHACGRPRYFFCITSGLLDSMLANYTPMLRQRLDVRVPERALMVYTQKVKQLFPDCITIIGGVEATIRRFTHFDYKDNALRRGIINDTKADLLLFGNAERPLLNLLTKMKGLEGHSFSKIRDKLGLSSIDGVSYRIGKEEIQKSVRKLPSFEECVSDKKKFSLLSRITWLLPDDAFIEPCGLGLVMHNRRSHVLQEKEMDLIYSLPFMRTIHPSAKDFEMNSRMTDGLKNSVIMGRGCWGSCSFCIIPLVQGKEVAVRSKESIVREIESLFIQGEKKINDLTLPTINMYGSHCALYREAEEIFSPIINEKITVYNKKEYCNQICVGCKYRVISDDLYPLLEEVEKLNRKYEGSSLELRSAIRHDIILGQKNLFRKIMQFVTRLKIAPEHLSDKVLKHMNKANREAFVEFLKEYEIVNNEQGTNKNLVPYLIAAHPGCTIEDMKELKEFCKEQGIFINLTQVFTPTPGILSTAMYYTGENPLTREPVYVPRSFREKKDQKAILFNPEEEMVDDNA